MSEPLSQNNPPSKIPQGKIPTPWTQQWKRIRFQLIPVLVAGATFLGTGWLWNRHYAPAEATGVVRVVEVEAASPITGVLIEPQGGFIKVHDRVAKNQIIARLDDAPLMAEFMVLQSNLNRLTKEVPAKAESIRLDLASRNIRGAEEYRRLDVEIQQKTLDILQCKAKIQTIQVELEKKQSLLEMLKNGNSREFDMVPLEKDIAEARILIEKENSSLAKQEEWLGTATSRLQQFPEVEKADVEILLQPIKAAIETENAKLSELKLHFQNLNIISPIDGNIIAIHRYPNQAIKAGEAVATIVNSRGQQIVTYIREDQHLSVLPNDKVEIRPNPASTQIYSSSIETVGPAYLQVPERHLRDKKLLEWGVPVMISIPPTLILKPGQTVSLRFNIKSDTPS